MRCCGCWGEAGFKPLRAEWFGEMPSPSDGVLQRHLFVLCVKAKGR